MFIVVVVAVACVAAPAAGRSLSVKLWAPWPTTVWSPVAEACEFVGEEGSEAYWEYVGKMADAFREFDARGEFEDVVERTTAVALGAAESWMVPALRAALATREFSARVEAHRSASGGEGCGEAEDAFAVSGAATACDVAGLEGLNGTTADRLGGHTLGASGPAIELTVRGFGRRFSEMFSAVKRMADAGRCVARVRWSLRGPGIPRTYLMGFGVNLDIKNLEYKNWDETVKSGEGESSPEPARGVVQGMDFTVLSARRPELTRELAGLRDALLEDSAADSTQLKMWKVRDLSLQASAKIVEAKDPLRALLEISQDVPKHASSLSAVPVSKEARQAATSQMRQRARSGGLSGVAYVGGAAYALDSPTFSIHTLMRAIRAEQRFRRSPYAAKLADIDVRDLAADASSAPRVDLLSGSKGAVAFANNLEKDEFYKRWPSTVQQLLYPSWQLHALAKNIYTLLAVLDLSTREAFDAVKILGLVLDQGYPVRVGVALAPRTRDLAYLDDAAAVPQPQPPQELLKPETIEGLFGALKTARGPRTSFAFLRRLADGLDDDDEVPRYEDALEAFAALASAKKSVHPDERKHPDLDLSSKKAAKELLANESMLEAIEEFLRTSATFAESKNVASNCFALNGRVRQGLARLQSEILPMLGEEQQHMADLVSRGQISDRTKSIYGKAIASSGTPLARFSAHAERLATIDDETQAYEAHTVPSAADAWRRGSAEAAVSLVVARDAATARGRGLEDLAAALLPDVRRVAVVDAEQNYVLVNGRRIDSPKGSEPLDPDEIRSLVLPFESHVAALVVDEVLDGDDGDLALVQRLRCAAGERAKKPKDLSKRALKAVGLDPFVVSAGVDEGVPVVAFLDPLTEAAQRGSSVLVALRDAGLAAVSLVLTPTPDLSELPLQKYYRFAVDAESPDYSGYATGCDFANLPRSQVLTLRVDTPEAWDVQTAAAAKDLDNLMGDAQDDLIEYQLKSLVVAGQCFDLRDRRPPNGLQLELAPLEHDTLVMQNLGYFQLRGQPGAFDIRLKPNTRSATLYDVLAPPDYADPAADGVAVVVDDLDGGATQLRVRKKPEFKDVELLEQTFKEEVEVDPGILGRWFAGGSSTKSSNETVHVFSLATGALYERFLKIMMLSVRKRTSGPVKFWLFENYLTPSFKSDAAKLAARFGFEVAYVTYKWPEWLRRQTVKQRIIWGYKILFLDVLFPLDVPKIIYVDADQVVRADLRELWELDLKGRPYGYTPFCDSRPETLGFQFWRSGYWADHLRGKPYHISALYVVDLNLFRRMAVGDQLRAVYDQLSRDPNSLANLDQDLPNYAQHSIPIFSLPQHWLWCESWCSDASKPASKTIDLCNNPLHKENKLAMARRVINGSLFHESWDQLDDEVKLVAFAP